VTLRRAPDGAGGQIFFQKNLPAGAPNWVRTITVPRRERGGDDTIDYPALDSLAALMWAVNLAALELHVPQWQVDARARPRRPDLIVFDLDPGPGAGVAECAAVAGLLRAALGADGLDPVVKTSGSKGLQLYARVGRAPDDTRDYAHRLAQDLERAHPDLVVSTMAKARRVDRVLIDWSQNSTTKTTVAPYSLRIREAPTVSAPVTWDEVEGAATGRGPDLLALGPDDVRARLESGGDLFAPLLGGGGQAVARSRSARKTASSSRSRS
jgi:bifunctional non-homologous end joining protein LigD